MSFRKSTSGGDSLSFSRSGQRTPLRSLQNEILHHSTDSHVKTKSVEAFKQTKEKVAVHHDNSHICLPTSNPTKNADEDTTACELGDVTYKSFSCAGGEVEVFSSSFCAEESIVLPLDQVITNTEDSVYSDSMIIQSSEEHVEHPYYNLKEASDASSLAVIDCIELANEHATEPSFDVTWKSFVCDGGEVELSDDLTKADETIPLPQPGLSEFPPELNLNSSYFSNPSVMYNYEEVKTDHPYCSREGVDSPITNTESDKLGNITMKFLNCTGDEVELGIAEATKQTDITIPLPADQSRTGLESDNGSLNSSLCTEEKEHFDHPYCTEVEHSLQPSSQENDKSQLECKEAVSLSSSEDEIANRSSNKAETRHQKQTEPLDTNSILHEDQIEVNHTQNESAIENVGAGVNYVSPVVTIPSSNVELDEAKEGVSFCQPMSQSLDTNSFLQQDQTEENDAQFNSTIENGDALAISVEPIGVTNKPNESVLHKASEELSVCQQLSQPLDTNSILKQDQIEENDAQYKSAIEKGDTVANVVPPSNPDELTSQWHEEELQFDVSALGSNIEPLQDKNEDVKSICKSATENCDVVVNVVPPVVTSQLPNTGESISEQCTAKEDSHLVSPHSSGTSNSNTTVPSTEATLVHSNNPPLVTSDTKDSALGLSPNAPAVSSTEPPQAETLPDVFRALQFGFLSPVVRRASLALLQARRELAGERFAPDDCAGAEKSLVAQLDVDGSEFWKEHLDSPMPRPLFNSTALVRKSQQFALNKANDEDLPCTMPQPEAAKPVLDFPLISDGPLQQQLRQMAEFLLLASGKMGPIPVSSAPIVPPAKAEFNNACVGTSPPKQVNHSINTSGQFERKREFDVEDQCTMTDSLLWNVCPDSLGSVPRPELEQRLLSSMIMVEALVQQLTAARAHHQSPAAPSQLREKLVQTEHTELSQTTMHRDLYLAALDRIKELEMDESSLQNLAQNMHSVKSTMTSLTSDTDAALCQMKQIEDVVRVDHQSLVSNYGQMKSLLGKSRESVMRMIQKVKDTVEQREDMRSQMEEAFSAKDAAFRVTEQLRTHCSMEISDLEKCLGSQQDLLCALNKAHPEQVALNKAYSETLDSASELLSKTIEEQSRLKQELCTVRSLLHKCTPILLQLNQKADAAVKDRDEHITERDQAVQEREQIEEELNQAHLNLQAAKEQIGDLNLQVTILTSEMGVLRQKLSETEEDRGQLDRKATELSATVSSTLASYAFLEQALASETTKLQQSWKDIQQAKDRAAELELSVGVSEQRVCELTQALSHSEEQLSHVQSVCESQASQITQLRDLCSQLSGVREMNEFLQMENELAREQMSDSERMLRANLQSLRERNIKCEDLNTELGQLQHENKNLHEELDCLRTRFSSSQVEHRERLAQMVTEITLLHHTLRGLTNELQLSLKEEEQDKALQPAHNLETRHHSSSFVDSVMVALTADKEQAQKPEPASSDELQCDSTLFSESSAFTRITSITPKKTSPDSDPEEEQINVSELLCGLDSTVTELSNALTLVQQRKDALLEDRHNTICRLQRELEATNDLYQSEVSELKYQLSRLNTRVEKGNAALQQKAQDDKTMTKLVSRFNEVQEILNKHKADNNELRREVVDLRRSLQQSKTEAEILRDELRNNGDQSSNPAKAMDQKIDLMKEVDRLKTRLQEEEEARIKLLERAKRHQAIYQTNQQKSEKELQMLNHMINKVRETLLCLPAVVKNSEHLQALIEYIG